MQYEWRRRRAIPVLAAGAAALAYTTASSAQAAGVLTDLGTLGGTLTSRATGINNAGVVIGQSNFRSFVFSGSGPIVDITPPFGGGNAAEAVNASGVIVGSGARSGANQAFRSTGSGPFQWLGTLGGTSSIAIDINASGVIVGESRNAAGQLRAFRTTSSAPMEDLGTLGGDSAQAKAINDTGTIVGYSATTGGLSRAFIHTGSGPMEELGALGETHSFAYDINNHGTVVGYSYPPGAYWQEAFRYTPSAGMVGLGNAGGLHSNANAVNDADIVVGQSALAVVPGLHAVLWHADNTLIDLDEWLDAVDPAVGAHWTLTDAHDINNSGLIVGVGKYSFQPNGALTFERAFLLDASSIVPEPSVVAGAPALAWVLVRRRPRRKR